MLGLRHPFTRALYEQDGHGNIRVTIDGRSGLFRPDGTWIEGDIFEADPQLLLLRSLGDLTVEQVAATIGRSVGATKALQRRGLRTLRTRLEKSFGISVPL